MPCRILFPFAPFLCLFSSYRLAGIDGSAGHYSRARVCPAIRWSHPVGRQEHPRAADIHSDRLHGRSKLHDGGYEHTPLYRSWDASRLRRAGVDRMLKTDTRVVWEDTGPNRPTYDEGGGSVRSREPGLTVSGTWSSFRLLGPGTGAIAGAEAVTSVRSPTEVAGLCAVVCGVCLSFSRQRSGPRYPHPTVAPRAVPVADRVHVRGSHGRVRPLSVPPAVMPFVMVYAAAAV